MNGNKQLSIINSSCNKRDYQLSIPKLIIANWKMNLGIKESVKLTDQILSVFKNKITKQEIVLCPDFTALYEVGLKLKKSQIKLGAQNIFWAENGAYTGEIGLKNLKECGVEYVILGHSERRNFLKEDLETIRKKLEFILNESEIIPIICLGESLKERQGGKYSVFLKKEIQTLFKNWTIKAKEIIIAYEPVWVISSNGSNLKINLDQAIEARELILENLKKVLTIDQVNKIKIIYGGSVNSQNAEELLNQGAFDGLLVGSASLNTNEFLKITI